jgi:hypothetical protein
MNVKDICSILYLRHRRRCPDRLRVAAPGSASVRPHPLSAHNMNRQAKAVSKPFSKHSRDRFLAPKEGCTTHSPLHRFSMRPQHRMFLDDTFKCARGALHKRTVNVHTTAAPHLHSPRLPSHQQPRRRWPEPPAAPGAWPGRGCSCPGPGCCRTPPTQSAAAGTRVNTGVTIEQAFTAFIACAMFAQHSCTRDTAQRMCKRSQQKTTAGQCS